LPFRATPTTVRSLPSAWKTRPTGSRFGHNRRASSSLMIVTAYNRSPLLLRPGNDTSAPELPARLSGTLKAIPASFTPGSAGAHWTRSR
jgi:hypothetical protein